MVRRYLKHLCGSSTQSGIGNTVSWDVSCRSADVELGNMCCVFLGDIIHARAGSKHIIVVSSYEGLMDLFDSQGAQYSHRPRRYMAYLYVLPSIAEYYLSHID